ncbi:unnamed protein product (macronuclear) [Paramecium tetraurelia]|uniref:Uncharacterized protein n=1 Tax=Paramecium tetraurelia TaxID=5888 RepID=A0EH56_PARTE|nr:uncharacterized protein GSPATT00026971001 [Paramecium tetraurelia]CAK94647.1 unnamed protein product [Paramecium tetraurelia]|eukprot:XP_001462020.1 hypothetical protein (macronuclear) [Paramecium tetraurelia strain d4-2]
MTTNLGPKLKFVMPLKKSLSFEDVFEENCDLEQKQWNNSKMDRKVSFAVSTLVFLRYSEEEILHFRHRLKSQIHSSIELIESSYLNPQLCSPGKQSRRKSCFKENDEHIN